MLKYIGGGKHIPGLPAQNLSEDEIIRYADAFNLDVEALIATLIERGIYAQPEINPPTPPEDDNEDVE